MRAKSIKKKSPTKKEIESANKDLTTTNHELQIRNDLLNEAYGYSEALFATIHEPMLVLDKNLRVKSANKTFYKIFKVKEKETEGVLLYDLGNGQWNIPRLRELLEDILPKNSHFYDFEITHTFQSIGEKIMLLNARRIIQKTNQEELILLAIADVTEQALARKKVEDSEKRFNTMLMQSPFAFAVLKGKNRVIAFANDRLKETWGKGNNIEGKPLLEVLPELKGTPFPALIDEVYKTGIPYHANEVLAPKHIKGQKDDVYYNFVYQPYREIDETISGVTITATEVTASVIVKKALEVQHEVEKKALKLVEDSEKRYNMMLMRSPLGFAVFKGENMVITLANDAIKEIWGKGNDVEGKPLFDLMSELKNTAFPVLIDNVYTRGIPFHGEELLVPILRDGKLVDAYFNFVYQPYLEVDETISGVTVIVYEVTAQALVNKALAEQRDIEQRALTSIEESNTRYYTMLMQSPFAFSIMKGKDMVVTIANDLMKEFWGKGMDVEGKTLLQLLPELKDQVFPEMIDQVFTNGKPIHLNQILAKLQHKGKLEDKYFNIVYQPHYEADNTISGVITIAYDVTEMVLARKKIEDSDKRYNMMLMKSPFAFAILKGKDMVLAMANDSIKGMWDKGNEIEGKPLIEVLPELKGQGFTELLDKVYTTGIPYIANDALAKVKRNGKMEDLYFNFVYQPYRETDDTISGVTIIAIEVTNEVIAKQKIKDSQQQLQNIFMQAPFALNIYEGKELVISLANKLFCEIIGKTESEILGKKLFDAFPETATQGLDKILSDIFSTGIPFKGNEFPVHFLKHDNEFNGYFDFIYQPIFDYNKNVSGVINVAIDVTDKVLSRKKIEESEQRFHNLIYTSPSAIGILVGEDLVITNANEPIIEIWGKGKEIMGKKYFEALPELAEQGYKEVFNQVYKTGIPFNAIETPVNILQNGVTTLKYYNFILYPQKNINGEINGIGIIATEVTAQAKYNLQIKESEQRFRSLADNVPIPIFILEPNAEASVSYFNKYWLDYTGQTIEEALGRAWDGIIHPDDVQVILDIYVPAFEKRQPYVLPSVRVRRYDGAYRWFQVHANPRYLPNGEFMGYIGAGFDIHESKLAVNALKESEEHFRLMANSMPQKITNADAEGNVIFFNQQWIDDTGLTFDELMDYGWVKAMHPDDLGPTVNNWKHAVATGDVFDMECRIRNKEGEYRWHLSRAVPIKDETGKILMWVGSNTDIHEQKEQKEGLQDAVAERTLELSAANEELEKMNKELEAFTYVASHDLQEPLRKIRTIAGRILEKENQNLSDKGKNYFYLMQNAAERMQTLIQDLLAFSRLSMSDRKFETINLNIIIEEVKKEFIETLVEKNATIEVKKVCDAKIIPFQFRQLMHNLISNALKFSNPKIPPHIIIESQNIEYSEINSAHLNNNVGQANLPPQKEYCHITISDNGIGFEREFTEKIFEVFQKLHGQDEYAGTGIGLAIVKKIIENHNGIITATSELNKGTTFNIYIPA